MTFSTKLTLSFTFLFVAIFCIMGITVYFFSERYTRQEFRERLQDRAHVTAQLYLDEDELSPRMMQRVRVQFTKSLPEEEVHLYHLNRTPAFESDSIDLPNLEQVFDRLNRELSIHFMNNERQWVGRLFDDNQGRFYVLVSAQDLYGQSKLRNLQEVLLISFLVSLVLVVICARFFTRQVLQPISGIVHEVNEIRASNLHLRVKERNVKDEIGYLTKTFNQMLDRLEMAFEMQKNFISNASHELRNPITAISGEIEVALLRKREPEEYMASLEILQKETDRLQKLTSDLLRLTQTGFDEVDMRQEDVRLDELLLECIDEQQRANQLARVLLHLEEMPEDPDLLRIKGNVSLLKIALGNVMDNASKFSGNQEVHVWLRLTDAQVTVVVQDKGMGIPANEQAHVFQTFYRAQNARGHSGTGIGLSLTDKIIRLHNGNMRFTSELGVGTTFSISFKR